MDIGTIFCTFIMQFVFLDSIKFRELFKRVFNAHSKHNSISQLALMPNALSKFHKIATVAHKNQLQLAKSQLDTAIDKCNTFPLWLPLSLCVCLSLSFNLLFTHVSAPIKSVTMWHVAGIRKPLSQNWPFHMPHTIQTHTAIHTCDTLKV